MQVGYEQAKYIYNSRNYNGVLNIAASASVMLNLQ